MERSSATPVEMLNTKDMTLVIDFWKSATDWERKSKLAKTFRPNTIKYLEFRAFSFRRSWFPDAMEEICFAESSLLRLMACLQ